MVDPCTDHRNRNLNRYRRPNHAPVTIEHTRTHQQQQQTQSEALSRPHAGNSQQPVTTASSITPFSLVHPCVRGWGAFGPYRFGFACGGIDGWAYPLGYWNTFGGACGLGIPFGGLFYC